MQQSKVAAVQVRSLLNNEKSLPKGGRAADKMLGEYEGIMSALKRTSSSWVTVKVVHTTSTRTPFAARGSNFDSPGGSHLSSIR